jgi:Fibrillar collagen C-terminal domain
MINEPSKSHDTQRSLEKESKVALYRSCEELRSVHPESGSYWIDPDGVSIGDPPIFVQCNMTTGFSRFIHCNILHWFCVWTGFTLISHNSEESIQADRCGDPGCYSRSVTYNATMRQIVALTHLSRSCRQFFKFDCFSVPFEFSSNVAPIR